MVLLQMPCLLSGQSPAPLLHQLSESRPALPASAGSHSYISPTYAGLCQIRAHWSLCMDPPSCFFFFFFANSSNGAWNGVQSEAVIGGFLPWEKRPVLLAVRWAADVFHAFRSRPGPLWWRWRALLDRGPVEVHEDYWAAHIKTGHANSTAPHPGSSVTASGRGGDRQHKQTSFVLVSPDLNCCYWLLGSYTVELFPSLLCLLFQIHMATGQNRI